MGIRDRAGGERKRVLLARALAVNADVLLMDEPLANLDPPHQADWMATTRALVAAGKTVAVSYTHLDVYKRQDWTEGNHHVKLIRFDNKIRGFITSGRAPVNLPRARIEGWTLGYDGSFDALNLRAAVDALDPRNELTGKLLPRRSKSQVTLGADYSVGPWSFGGSLLQVGRRYDDAANATPLASYTTVDLQASYAFARDWNCLLYTSRCV